MSSSKKKKIFFLIDRDNIFNINMYKDINLRNKCLNVCLRVIWELDLIYSLQFSWTRHAYEELVAWTQMKVLYSCLSTTLSILLIRALLYGIYLFEWVLYLVDIYIYNYTNCGVDNYEIWLLIKCTAHEFGILDRRRKTKRDLNLFVFENSNPFLW